jgi:uncharacterized repeat protein (TIGR04002 family)
VKIDRQIKLMITAALFAAITATFILFVRVPAGVGIIHVGDSVIYLAACILPAPYALIAAAFGGAAANALGGHVIFVIPTFIIKALITLPFSSKSDRIITVRNVLMVIPAGAITVIGYFIAVWLLFDRGTALAAVYGDLVQAAGSAVLFIVLAIALDKINFKGRYAI